MEFKAYRYIEKIPRVIRYVIGVPCLLYGIVAILTPLPFGTICTIIGIACFASAGKMVHVQKLRKGAIHLLKNPNSYFIKHKVKDFKRHVTDLVLPAAKPVSRPLPRKCVKVTKKQQLPLYKAYADMDDFESFLREKRVPIISRATGDYIVSILQKHGAKSFLEIGAAEGFSTIYIKQQFPDVFITSIERAESAIEAARYNADYFNMDISFIQADASLYIPETIFDVIFIDGQKSEYMHYIDHYLPYLKENGIMIIDDVVKFAHKTGDIKGHLSSLGSYTVVHTDPDDGIGIFTRNTETIDKMRPWL